MSVSINIPDWIEKHERRLLAMGITELPPPTKARTPYQEARYLRREVKKLRTIRHLLKRYMETVPGEARDKLMDELVEKVYTK